MQVTANVDVWNENISVTKKTHLKLGTLEFITTDTGYTLQGVCLFSFKLQIDLSEGTIYIQIHP